MYRVKTLSDQTWKPWEQQDGKPTLVRQAGLVEPFNDGPQASQHSTHVGRPPILTAGNSNGDLAMMEFAPQANGRFQSARTPRRRRARICLRCQCRGSATSGKSTQLDYNQYEKRLETRF